MSREVVPRFIALPPSPDLPDGVADAGELRIDRTDL
jgi:hypothetical protein